MSLLMRTAGSPTENCGVKVFNKTLTLNLRPSLFYGTERNGTESVVALFYGTERNTANMVNFHKSNLML